MASQIRGYENSIILLSSLFHFRFIFFVISEQDDIIDSISASVTRLHQKAININDETSLHTVFIFLIAPLDIQSLFFLFFLIFEELTTFHSIETLKQHGCRCRWYHYRSETRDCLCE